MSMSRKSASSEESFPRDGPLARLKASRPSAQRRDFYWVRLGAALGLSVGVMAPASALGQAGIRPIGVRHYELADGRRVEYPFGLAQIEFMGEITAGRVIFGPEDLEPILGVTALESVGMTIDPANQTLKRLPAIPLK